MAGRQSSPANMPRQRRQRSQRIPSPNTAISLNTNAISTPSTFSNEARPVHPQRRKTNYGIGKRKEFLLPTAETARLSLQLFESLTKLAARFTFSKRNLPLERLDDLIDNWFFLLDKLDDERRTDVDGKDGNGEGRMDVDGKDVNAESRTTVKRVVFVIILAAIQILFTEKNLPRSDVEHVIRPFLETHQYHTGEGNWKQMNAAVKYLQAVSKCAHKIGNSAFAIPLLNPKCLYWFINGVQESYLSDSAPVLQMPQFECARPAILLYIVLGGAKSPIPLARIMKILEPEPRPQRPYYFFPCLPERCEEPLFSERIREAVQYGVAALACSVGLDIPSQPQLVDPITLPPNMQWCPSPIQVAIVLSYASQPLDVILGEDGSQVTKWYPGSALLMHGISLRVTTRSELYTMVWNGEKQIEGTANR